MWCTAVSYGRMSEPRGWWYTHPALTTTTSEEKTRVMADPDPTVYGWRFKDLSGQKFGRWTVTGFAGQQPGGHFIWHCVCECGNKGVIAGRCLRGGTSQSCGCFRDEVLVKARRRHGGYYSSEYRTWSGIKSRCFNQKSKVWYCYGGRGITMCQRWVESFQAFLDDMGPKPSPKHSIDRIDSNGNYEPGNCRWATQTEQARNKCSNHLLTFRGETLPASEWAERAGIQYGCLLARLREGWTVERALTAPVQKKRPRKAKVPPADENNP